MPTSTEKLSFLQHEFPALLADIDPALKPLFGKMSVHQMIEHFSDTFRIASGKQAHQQILTKPEQVEKMQAFILSDKPFRDNTPNPLLPDTPPPAKHHDISQSIAELKEEIDYFVTVFQKDGHITRNPFFGDLDREKNIHLLYKHALHHLRQFGITVS